MVLIRYIFRLKLDICEVQDPEFLPVPDVDVHHIVNICHNLAVFKVKRVQRDINIRHVAQHGVVHRRYGMSGEKLAAAAQHHSKTYQDDGEAE